MLPVFFCGCQEKELKLTIRYQQIDGLNQGAPVIFDRNPIGRVQGISRSRDDLYMVDIAIKKNFVNAVTEHSRFLIINDPQDIIKKAIEMTLMEEGGAPLKGGAILDGSTRPSAFFEQLQNDFEKGIKELKNQIDKFAKDLDNVPESEEFKSLQKELKGLSEEIRKAGEAAREKLEKEILPRLKEEIKRLREMLRKLREKEKAETLKI
jgi:paraquat-inducible protein B